MGRFLSSLTRALKDCLKGLTMYGLIDGAYAEKRRIDELFMFSLFGSAIGVPHLFNYYHLRLYPYCLGRYDAWKRDTLREKDFFDHIRGD